MASRVAPPVRCAGCGTDIDPLRAGHVAIVAAQTRYFCSFEGCRSRFFDAVAAKAARRGASDVPAGTVAFDVRAGDPDSESPPELPLPPRVREAANELLEPVAPLHADASERVMDPPAPRELTLLLVALTLVAGLLSMSLELAEPTALVRWSRLILIAVAVSTIAGHAFMNRSAGDDTPAADPALPHPLVFVGPPALGLVVAVAGTWASETHRDRSLFLAATIVTIVAATIGLTTLASRAVDQGRRWVHRLLDNETDAAAAPEPIPGSTIVVSAGSTIPADAVITEGDAEVECWVEASVPQRRRVGDSVVAGSRVRSGFLRGAVTFAGTERALARAVLAPRHRPDVHSEAARLPRALVERWSPVVALVAAALHLALRGSPMDVAMVGVSVYAALASVSLALLPSLTLARGVLVGLDRGVVYRTPKAWDQAARATAGVFCARGTLLRGEPELVEVETFGGHDADRTHDEVLAIAASTFVSESTPIAHALKRAARERGVPLDLVRNTRSHEGRGVIGTSSAGEAICVGTRDWMLERRVSVAVAEDAMARLEASGRTVMLVARGGRLLGICALQDGLRPGARAAVQHLLDARVEPVLMSSDTGATCEALGRALDIDHLRAEVLDDERGAAIQRIRDTGATVAVLGHVGLDDVALRTGDVAVALGDAGRASEDAGIATVIDDVRDAAIAIAVAQRWRKRAVSVFGLVLAPAAFGSMIVTAGLLAPEYAPIAQLLGTAAAVWQLTSEDRPE